MYAERDLAPPSFPHSWIARVAIYLVFAAEFAQLLFSSKSAEIVPLNLGLYFIFLILYSAVLLRPTVPSTLLHLYFALQCFLVAVLLWLNPELGTLTALFVLLSFQSASAFTKFSHWVWASIFAVLTAIPLMFNLGALEGLARALLPITGIFMLSAYMVVNRELDAARSKSQAMVSQLEEANRQLQSYAAQVEELTAIEERNRLARELHDSISQTIFSIVLTTRSAEILLERDPHLARRQLEQLQTLTQSALTEMRGLITQLRPKLEKASIEQDPS